jgi:hypothetical protein
MSVPVKRVRVKGTGAKKVRVRGVEVKRVRVRVSPTPEKYP